MISNFITSPMSIQRREMSRVKFRHTHPLFFWTKKKREVQKQVSMSFTFRNDAFEIGLGTMDYAVGHEFLNFSRYDNLCVYTM